MKPIKLPNLAFFSHLSHIKNGYKNVLVPNGQSVALLFSIICYTGIFSACSLIDSKKDCPDITTTTDSLSAKDKNSIPYTGYDSIKFILLPSGTYHTFYGLGRVNQLNKSFSNKDPDCPSDIEYCEYESFAFKSLTAPNVPIHLILYIDCPVGGTETKLTFRGLEFDFGPYRVYGPGGVDSVIIQGKVYNNVFRVRRTGFETDTTSYLLYNIKDGIIKLKISESEFWEKVLN